MENREDHNREFTKRFKEPGGTPGGLGMFLFGLALAVVGGYLIMNQTQVTTSYWNWFGNRTFGLTLVPLIIGIGLLFFNGKSLFGWLLAGCGFLIIFAGIITNLDIYFRTTSLFNLILMLTLFAAGLGLMARAFKGR
jgi:hypothetical protein